MKWDPLLCWISVPLLSLGLAVTSCASTPANEYAATHTYLQDRPPFEPDAFAVPIARGKDYTVFAAFRTGVDSSFIDGVAPVAGAEDSKYDWIQGHAPKLAVYPGEWDTVPIFVPQPARARLVDRCVEGHQLRHLHADLAWHREDFPLSPQRWPRYHEVKSKTGTSNHGDSSVPRFVEYQPGKYAFAGQEVFKGGGGTTGHIYARMLWQLKETLPDLEWEWVGVEIDGVSVAPESRPPGMELTNPLKLTFHQPREEWAAAARKEKDKEAALD